MSSEVCVTSVIIILVRALHFRVCSVTDVFAQTIPAKSVQTFPEYYSLPRFHRSKANATVKLVLIGNEVLLCGF